MPRRAGAVIVLLLLLGLGLKLGRYGAQPLAPETAAADRLALQMQAAGWQALGQRPLLSDGSLAAHRFRRGTCQMEVVLLPPGPAYGAVVREALGDRAHLLEQAPGAAPGGMAARAGQLAWVLGLGAAPDLFRRMEASEGDCPPRPGG
jgi:hypothetical protein